MSPSREAYLLRKMSRDDCSCGAAALNAIAKYPVVDDSTLERVASMLGEQDFSTKGASAKGLLAMLSVFKIGQQLHRRSGQYPQFPGFTDFVDPIADEWILLNDGKVGWFAMYCLPGSVPDREVCQHWTALCREARPSMVDKQWHYALHDNGELQDIMTAKQACEYVTEFAAQEDHWVSNSDCACLETVTSCRCRPCHWLGMTTLSHPHLRTADQRSEGGVKKAQCWSCGWRGKQRAMVYLRR